MKKTLLAFGLFLATLPLFAQKKSLTFNKDGNFKIVQFTDLHWYEKSEKTPVNVQTIERTLSLEKPDFVVITGDIVTASPEEEGWNHLASTIEKYNTPWTVTFGNHDQENDLKKEYTYQMLKKYPNFVGEKGNVYGVGNFSIPVYDRKGKISSVLYFLDSNDYTKSPLLGSYDWVKSDQIAWFCKQSDEYALKNQGNPIPSLAFFHIPLQEYNFVLQDPATVGEKGEEVSPSEVNSGLFASFLEKKNVMGAFVGHDHENNFIGIHKNIALAYGNCSGADAYGKLPRGGRVIVLKENKFSFESWVNNSQGVKDKFYYPSGIGEITDTKSIEKALKVNPSKKGIKYKYFETENKIRTVKDIEKLKLKKEGILPSFSIENADSKDHFAYSFSGYILVPETANYKFYAYSDDGSVIKIDDKEVVNNDGGHSPRRKEGIIALEKGFHKIEVLYFEDYMGQILDVGVSSIFFNESSIPADWLFYK